MTPNLLLGLVNLGVAVLVAALSLPLVRGRVPMNRLYGARFSLSFASEEAWYAINRYCGRRMIEWSAVLAAVGVATFYAPPLYDREALALAFAFAPLLLLLPCWQAWRWARERAGREADAS